MKGKVLGLLSIGLVACPLAATAQVTNLEYQSDAIVGTSSYLPTGFTQAIGNNELPVLPTSPFVGSMTASFTVDGSVSANNLTLAAFSVNFSGNDFIGGNRASFSTGELLNAPDAFATVPLGFNITTSNGAITGATLNWSDLFDVYHGPSSIVNIGPNGDSLAYFYGTTDGGCQNFVGIAGTPGNPSVPTFSYTGPSVNPCSLEGSSKTAGSWIVSTVPEIDPASATGGVTLLIGGLMMLRGRRVNIPRD